MVRGPRRRSLAARFIPGYYRGDDQPAELELLAGSRWALARALTLRVDHAALLDRGELEHQVELLQPEGLLGRAVMAVRAVDHLAVPRIRGHDAHPALRVP